MATPIDNATFAEGRGTRRTRPTAAQVIALGLVAAAFGWAIWLLDERPLAEQVELLPGTILPASELAVVEAALDRAQLVDHRMDGGQVWVPPQRHAAYMRALVDAEALPREFGSSLRRALENDSPWRSRAVQEEMLRVAIQDELAHVIRSMPGIERAAVLYDGGDRPGFPGAAAARIATASVNVRTRPDTPLESSRVQAIRVLVAASIAGLEAERVAVTDLRTGRVHAGPLEQPEADEVADPELARRAAHERHLATKIRQALSFVQGAVVDVTVAFPDETTAAPDPGTTAPEPTLSRRQQRVADANAPAEIDADGESEPTSPPPLPSPARRRAAPRIIVTVAVPESSLALMDGGESVPADGRRETQAVEARERLVAHVHHLLPAPERPGDHRVVVTTFGVPGVDAGARPAVAAPAQPTSLGRMIDDTAAAVRDGRPTDVPRQTWLVLAAAVVGVVVWFVLREAPPSRVERPQRSRRRAPSRIDWESFENAAAGHDGTSSRSDIASTDATRGVAA